MDASVDVNEGISVKANITETSVSLNFMKMKDNIISTLEKMIIRIKRFSL